MITDKLRQSIFERDNYTCQYCGRSAYDTDLEIEHIIPISKGGNDDTRNLVTACKNCNRKKGARILTIGELQQIADKINTSLEYLMSLASEEPQNERSVKIMLYLTPELIADVRDWCHVKRITANSFITGLIEEHLHSDKAQEKLAFFRKLSEDD